MGQGGKFVRYPFSVNFLGFFLKNSSLAAFADFGNTAVKRLRMRELLSELSFQLVQRLRKSISLGAFIALEKRVNSRKLSFNTRKILRNFLPYIFRCFLIFCVFVQSALLCIQFAFIFPALSEISHMRVTFDRGVPGYWVLIVGSDARACARALKSCVLKWRQRQIKFNGFDEFKDPSDPAFI